MKDKNTAATLAFFGGFLGLHKFYLEEQGAGLFYVFLTAVTVRIFKMPLAVLLGVIDCVMLLNMSDEDFDEKYNQKGAQTGRSSNRRREHKRRAGPNNRYERYQERERERRQAGKKSTRSNTRRSRARNAAPERTTNRPSPRSRTRINPKVKAELEDGIRYFKDYEFDRAIKAFEEVLNHEPSNVAAHFNLGCAYSAEEKKDKAFYHLDRAVALGFSDFDRIRTHDSLAFLRIQDRFEEFAENGYRLVQDIPAPEAETGDKVAASGQEKPVMDSAPTGDLLEQLSRLAELREKGLLTEAEFTSQKKRLLG